MKRTAYRDRDHKFGQAMLALRSAMGLTQTELAELLGVSRFALGGWEAGDKYPKLEHLKHFITLAVQQRAFPIGHEANEIRALWELAHQKVLLDEYWLSTLLPTSSMQPIHSDQTNETRNISSTRLPSTPKPRLDWGDALRVPNFYGREDELRLLTEWVVEEHCQVISIVGFGGIGKSSLVVQLMHQLANHFEVVIWRSLRDVPTYEALLDDCLHLLTSQPLEELPTSLEERQNLLLKYMRSSRMLLVFDNLESILEQSENTGRLRPNYENLGRVLYLGAQIEHQSCILLTSREKVSDLISQEGAQSPVRTLRLAQLDVDACKQLLMEKNVIGSESENARLIKAYEGNPLALKIVAQTIVELFNGEVTPFLENGEVIFGGVRRLLDEQVARLSRVERDVLIWLAILREPSTLEDLHSVLFQATARSGLLEALEALSRRSLIERGQARGSFTLQSVVLEYVTARLITAVCDEIETGSLERLIKYGFELAHTREYVRQTQERLIVIPILARLRTTYLLQSRLEERLRTLLQEMAGQSEETQGYGPANLVVMLRLLRGNLRGIDLSHLVLRDLYLQGVEMQDAQLIGATIRGTFFTEAFDALTAVAISSTGEYWAAASRRGEVRMWEAKGQLLCHVWRGHTTTVWTLAFSPDEKFLATGSNDGSVKLWEVASGRLIWFVRNTNDVNRLSFSPDGSLLAGAAYDDGVLIWDVATGTLIQALLHPKPIPVVSWSPDGQTLASGDIEGSIHLWAMNHLESPRQLQSLVDHTGLADGLAFAPDARTLASASWDGTVKLWEVASGRLLQTLTGHTDRVGRLAWSPDGATIASSGVDQVILLWDVEQGGYRGTLKGHTSHIYEIAFTPDSHSLLSSGRDGSLRVWDVVTEQCVRVMHGYAASVNDVDWSPEGHRLVSGGTDLVVTLWDLRTGRPLHILQEHISVVCAVGWSPDGRWLASSESEYGIRLWDLTSSANFQFLRRPDTSGNYSYKVVWSPDGYRLASGTHQHGVMIWNVLSGEEIRIGDQLATWFPVIAWSPDGTRLAGGGADGCIYIWNVNENSLEQQLSKHHSRIMSLVWSPDGTQVASGAMGATGGELFVWRLAQSQRSSSFTGHASVVSAIAWDATGRHLISGTGYGHLRWWDVQSGELLWKLKAHKGAIQSLKTSSDGTKLASCGDDGAIMIWDVSSSEHLQTLRHDRPYERLNITGIKGLTEAQKEMLTTLGAVVDDAAKMPLINASYG